MRKLVISGGKIMRETGEARKYRHYIHSPFTIEHQGVRVSCSEDGKLTLSKETTEEGEVVYDEINCSASLINRISRMLLASRKVVWKNEPYKEEE